MQTREGRIPVVNFLVYTRSALFDYTWVYGLEDKALETDLQQHAINWLNTNVLSELSPVISFFQFRQQCALMIAQESGTRTDAQSRPIFQRAFFLWQPTEGMYYRHLNLLVEYLQAKAQDVYSELPNDAYRINTATRQFEVDLKKLDRDSLKYKRKTSWRLPGDLSWDDVFREKLTVEVPSSWPFSKMTEGLANVPLSSSELIHIGHSIHFENRCPAQKPWIVSAKPADGDQELITVRSADGQPVQKIKKNGNTGGLNNNFKPDGRLRFGARSSEFQPPPGRKNAPPAPLPQVPQAKTVEPAPADRSSEVDDLLAEFSNLAKSYGEGAKLNVIQKLLERDQIAVRRAAVRVIFLLTPAMPEIPIEMITAWHSLINELLLSHRNSLKSLHEEWIRRIYKLEDITLTLISKSQPNWRGEFRTSCETLRATLQDER
jgi:hypothetical protein